jgi:hypothetical protein
MQTTNAIDPVLAEFGPETVTVRLVRAMFGAMPFAPPQLPYASLAECAVAAVPGAAPAVASGALALSASPEVQSALSAARMIDTGDAGIAVYSGVQSAFQLFFGGGLRAIDTDAEQGVDAALKLVALAYITHQLFPGPPQDAAAAFTSTSAGQTLGYYYAAVEVVLPFADNALSGTGNIIQTLWARHGSAAMSKLGALPGGGQMAGAAQGVLGSLVAPIEGAVRQVMPYARQIAGSAQQHLPGVLGAADKVAGAVAAGADALPVYRYLGARLAAEACVLRASRAPSA